MGHAAAGVWGMELGVGDGREEKRDSDELLDAPTAAGWVELRDGGRKEEVGVVNDVTKKGCDEAITVVIEASSEEERRRLEVGG